MNRCCEEIDTLLGLVTRFWLLLSAGVLSCTVALGQPFAYITNQDSNSVSVIDAAANTLFATVPVEFNPFGVAVTPDGTRAYVANLGSASVSGDRHGYHTVVASITVGPRPFGVAILRTGLARM